MLGSANQAAIKLFGKRFRVAKFPMCFVMGSRFSSKTMKIYDNYGEIGKALEM